MTGHRPDIDGLRALAVIPVVLYHAGIPGFSGGFAGVDVFFVISGFLITKMIADDLGRGQFSLSDFYARRVRRIVPALAVMLISVSIVALVVFTPQELRGYGTSLAAAAFFSANIYFWRTENYFAAEAEPSPLLHTWSLAVEEQFYIFWPLGLMLIAALGLRRYLPVLTLLGLVAAFAAALVLVRLSPQFAFYMLPARAWELLLGAVLALGAIPAIKGTLAREAAAALGVAAIVFAVVALNARTETPGLWLLVPCVGAALVIHAGTSGPSLAARLLSLGPVVWIGLISYSLYLWHWPILIMPKVVLARELVTSEIVFALVMSLATAALSWRYVEQPFRRKSISLPKVRQAFLTGGAVTLVALVLAGGAMAHFSGVLWRGSSAKQMADAATNRNGAPHCLMDARSSRSTTELPPLTDCVFGAADKGQPATALWGDSHAHHLRPAMEDWASANGTSFRQIAKALCPPLIGATPATAPRDMREDCRRFNDQALAWIKATPSVRQVILSARWPIYVGRSQPRHGVSPILTVSDDVPMDARDAMAAFAISLNATLKALTDAGKSVVIIAPLPDFYQSGAKCIARSERFSWDKTRCGAAVAETSSRLGPVTTVLKAAAAQHSGVTIVETAPLFCDAVLCQPWNKGVVQFRDDNHVTNEGAQRIVERLPPP